ncbi:MAG: cation transporter [Candidatus Aenigmatarchaeota archaeon]
MIFKEIPDPSLLGIAVAIASIIVMPILTLKKYLVGKRINSQSLVADSKETLACSFLSLALLLGLGLNYSFGFWQADPSAGMVIVIFLFRGELKDGKRQGRKSIKALFVKLLIVRYKNQIY